MVPSVDSDSGTNESSQDTAVDKSGSDSNIGDAAQSTTEETESVSSTAEETDTDSSTTEGDDEESEAEQNWEHLLRETFCKMNITNITNTDRLLKEPLFSEFHEVLRDTLQGRIKSV